jgi:hypothetical protein
LEDEKPQMKLDHALNDLAAAEKAYSSDKSPTARSSLNYALTEAADYGMYLQRWKEVEAWARRGIAIDPENSVNNYGNLAHALLFQGKYGEALAVYREHWADPNGAQFLGESVIDDFDELAAHKISHPDVARIKATMAKELPAMLKQRGRRDFEESKAKIETDEAAFGKEATDENRFRLANELVIGSRAAMFVRDWTASEKWAVRSVAIVGTDRGLSIGAIRQAMALLFQGSYARALEIFRNNWATSDGETTLGARVLNELDYLEKAGITHPDIARLKRAMGVGAR